MIVISDKKCYSIIACTASIIPVDDLHTVERQRIGQVVLFSVGPYGAA